MGLFTIEQPHFLCLYLKVPIRKRFKYSIMRDLILLSEQPN